MISRRWLGTGGVVAPLVFVAAVLVVAANRPGYSHSRQAVSELGEVGGRLSLLMNGGFLVYGLLVIGLAFGLQEAIKGGRGDWLGPVLLALYGLCYVAVAFAPCDPGCIGTSQAWHEKTHFLLGRLIIMLSLATPLVCFPRFAKDPAWSRIGGLLVVLPVVGYLIFLGLVPGLQFGMQQRLWLACTLAWVLALGVQLLRTAQETRTTGPGAAPRPAS
jgi:hypothetical membrane protein